jgi:hypothetical protein
MIKTPKAYFSVMLLWFPVVSVSIYIALLLAIPLGDFLYERNGYSWSASNDGSFESILSLLLLVGLFMGFGQWIVMSTKIKKAYAWILATLIGLFIGIFISFYLFFFMGVIFSRFGEYYRIYEWIWMIATFMGAGMFTGACQWVSIKRRLANSLKWALATGLSFTVGVLVMDIVRSYLIDRPLGFVDHSLGQTILSVSIGLISGVFAEPLIIRPEIEKSDHQEIATR